MFFFCCQLKIFNWWYVCHIWPNIQIWWKISRCVLSVDKSVTKVTQWDRAQLFHSSNSNCKRVSFLKNICTNQHISARSWCNFQINILITVKKILSNQDFHCSKCPNSRNVGPTTSKIYQQVCISVLMTSVAYKFTLVKIYGFSNPKFTYTGSINILMTISTKFWVILPIFRP